MPQSNLPPQIVPDQPCTALAPMQDVTDLPFMKLLGEFGPPDFFVTEYFRVHEHSTPEKHILDSITDHGTGRPVFAQMIGEDIIHLERTVRILDRYPIAGIDLNMGCPAPKVYKKNVGGGLLRDLDKVELLFRRLREICQGRFTVKTRLGFENTENFDRFLELVETYGIDLLSLHGRTVKQMYRGEVDYSLIRQAKRSVSCPVLANGNITSVHKAREVLEYTGCDGVMIGRSAIRNPWFFQQFRHLFHGNRPYSPTLRDVRYYIERLWATTDKPNLPENSHLNRMKKFVNFVGQGVDPKGSFLKMMRRAQSPHDFFNICDHFMLDNGNAEIPFAPEPYEGVHARPNCEDSNCSLSLAK